MTTTIDKDKAFELLDAAVALKGANYSMPRGEGCTYFEEDGTTPVCIVGHALASVGASLGDLGPVRVSKNAEISYGKDAEMDNQRVFRSTNVDGVEFTGTAREVLDLAQGFQDDGYSWGAAVKAAREATFNAKDTK